MHSPLALAAGRGRSSGWIGALLAALIAGLLGAATYGSEPAAGAGDKAVASGWAFSKYPEAQPLCTGLRPFRGAYFARSDCGHGQVAVSGTTATSSVTADYYGNGATTPFASQAATFVSGTTWRFAIRPAATWPAGQITVRLRADGQDVVGEYAFFHNELGADLAAASRAQGYRPGDAVPVSGTLNELKSLLVDTTKTPVAGTFKLQVVTASGEIRGPYGPFTANKGGAGQISETLPEAATAGLTATADSDFETAVAIELVDASYTDGSTGAWTSKRSVAGVVTVTAAPETLVVENSFVSSVGWVKPGDSYPFRVLVKNFSAQPRSGAVVTLPVVDGTTFASATPTSGSGTASIAGGVVTWNVGGMPAATAAGPAVKTLVVQATADTLAQDAQVVWKNISSTANLTYTGGPAGISDTSQGPKVIPPSPTFDKARYGYRPFPVVPVDFRDRKHTNSHSGERLAAVINSPNLAGSTYNLYQEMSYGQLFPHGTVPAAAIARAGWDVQWSSPHRQSSGWSFTGHASGNLPFGGACIGTTTGAVPDSPLTPDRIANGWYQLPGDTNYYGGDPTNMALLLSYYGTALPVDTPLNTVRGNIVTAATLLIDSACGVIGRAVYDAAHIADPEIDYSDYDTDKDGVVDFFMMVYTGAGGNGVSQQSVPPYDNIWPHSSDLRQQFTDSASGQTGYISDDQLKDNAGRPLFYVDSTRSKMTTDTTLFPVYVRVGPYNVNPETAIERASVISHEYGHSLGLPDFYSVGNRSTYGDWNLMASDKSQHMDVFGKQEMGWLVPRVLKQGETTVTGWRDSKVNTKRIDWVQPNGTPYTLTGPTVNNGEAYVAKLTGRTLLDSKNFDVDPEPVAAPFVKGSGSHAWWSGQGNNFGCASLAGRSLDIHLPELATLPEGTPVTLTFKSMWDIEWDWDFGFVMATTDGGQGADASYTALPSAKGYTTSADDGNPNLVECLTKWGHGLTGTSGSYAAGTQATDRIGSQASGVVAGVDLVKYPQGGFLADEYDLTAFAGRGTIPAIRFSYYSDTGVARPAWFIDDVKVTAQTATGPRVLYQSDFETDEEPFVYNGGCKGGLGVGTCTNGWQHVSAADEGPLDHAYYLEMRDRSGFDWDGNGQSDRGPIAFSPGLLLVYTDEAHGYGNARTADPPAQSPLDARPEPGNNNPNLNDAAFTAGTTFSDGGAGWVDNYVDPSRPDQRWRFDYDCLTFQVLTMTGDDIGPPTSPGNLTGDVKLTLGAGCGSYDYGHLGQGGGGGGGGNTAPTAVIQAKPTTANSPGQPVKFDGTLSSDDRQTPAELTYEWDFTNDGTYDASGDSVRYRYGASGTFTAKLRVTDADGAAGEATIEIVVR
jgi:M6 family metalloprotease-like protein